MKVLAIMLALAGLASTAPLNAQILSRIPTGQTTAQGSWTLVGRDGNGNQIYERRTQDRNGNIVVQRARRDVNGNMSIISTSTVNNGNRGNNDCNYSQSTNTVGDIIFGRTGNNANNCDDRNSRVNGGWYQVGRDGSGSRVYERQTRDSNGNVIIQHARRNSNGSFTILNSRIVRNNSRHNNGRNNNGRNNNDEAYNTGTYNNGRGNGQSDKEWQKQQKKQDKEMKKNDKNDKNDNGHRD